MGGKGRKKVNDFSRPSLKATTGWVEKHEPLGILCTISGNTGLDPHCSEGFYNFDDMDRFIEVAAGA